jgi:hypothetical protein
MPISQKEEKQNSPTLHVAGCENHPVNKLLRDQEVYDEYALRRKLSIFIRAQEACATLGVDLGAVECGALREMKRRTRQKKKR